MNLILKIEGLTVKRENKLILKDIDLAVKPGDITCVVGPNGAGKSTLFSSVICPVESGLNICKGHIELNARDIKSLDRKNIARIAALVPQKPEFSFNYTVSQIVDMARIPFRGLFAVSSDHDREVTNRAMKLADVKDLEERQLSSLSGGQVQRVFIARALAQEPKLLLLDETTSNLDMSGSIEIMEILRRICMDTGMAVLVIFHDLNLAASYCSNALAIKEGMIFASGPVSKVFTSATLSGLMDSSVLVRKSGFSGLTFLSALPRSSLKVRDEYKNKKFHFIAGGGRASPYMMALADSGIKYGISPVNEGDSDWSLAKDLGLELIEMPSFSSVSAPVLEQEKTALETSDIVVFPSVPIGAANTSVLDMVEYAQKINKQIWIETGLDFNLRNYSGRESAERFESILKNSKTIKYKNLAGFLEILCSYES